MAIPKIGDIDSQGQHINFPKTGDRRDLSPASEVGMESPLKLCLLHSRQNLIFLLGA
jgi:hypothetical protein